VTANKNGFGEYGKYAHVPVIYTTEPDELGRARLFIRFDWGAATTTMFQHLEQAVAKDRLPKARLSRMKAVLDWHFEKGRAWSDRLGVPESDPVDYSTFGNLVDQNREVCNELYPLLGITWAPAYRPQVRLDKQRDACLLANAKQPADVYEARRFPVQAEAEEAVDG